MLLYHLNPCLLFDCLTSIELRDRQGSMSGMREANLRDAGTLKRGIPPRAFFKLLYPGGFYMLILAVSNTKLLYGIVS